MRIKYFPNVQSENYDLKPFVATIILHVTKYLHAKLLSFQLRP